MTEVGWELQLKTAMRQLRKEGIAARLNVMGCCRSCISYEGLTKTPEQPLVWHYGGQGGRVQFDHDGVPFVADRAHSRSGYEPEVLFFNHGNTGAERAFEVFTDAGLTVEWDRSDGQCLQVIGPSKEQVELLRCQAEAYRMHEHWLLMRERKRAQVERLRCEADELEASLA